MASEVRAAPLFVASALCLLGCQPIVELVPTAELEARSGDWLVIARFASNRVLDANLVRVSGDLTAIGSIEAGGEPEAMRVVWRIRPEELVGPDGQPISDEALERAVARPAEVPASDRGLGSCGRCLVPSRSEPPQIVHPGDSCSPPRFAKTWTFGGGPTPPEISLERARMGVRLELPGACPCPLPETRRTGAALGQPLFEWLDGDRAKPLPALFAVAPDGSVGFFGAGHATRVDGRRPARTVPLDPLVEGRPAFAAGLPGGRFAVLGERLSPERLTQRVLSLFGPELEASTSIASLRVRASGLTWLEHAERLLVLGESGDEGGRAAIQLCSLDPFECAPTETISSLDDRLGHAVELADGTIVMVGRTGSIVYLHDGSFRVGTGAALQDRALQVLGAVGDRLFACFAILVDGGRDGVEIRTATISKDAPEGGEAGWKLLVAEERGRCVSISPAGGRSASTRSLIQVEGGDGSAIEARIFDASGEVLQLERDQCESSQPVVPRISLPGVLGTPLALISENGHSVAVTEQGVFRSDDQATEQVFAQIYEPPVDLASRAWNAAVPLPSAGGARWIVLGAGPSALVIEDRGASTSSISVDLPGFGAGEEVVAAVRDRSASVPGREVVLALGWSGSPRRCHWDTSSPSVAPWVRRIALEIDRAGRVSASVERILPSPDLPLGLEPNERLIDVAEAAPGVFVIVAEGRAAPLFVLDLRAAPALRRVAVSWDDPLTPEVDEQPNAAEGRPCELRRTADRVPRDRPVPLAAQLWRAVAASRAPGAGGVAWAAGCRGALVRVDPFTARGDAISLLRAPSPEQLHAPGVDAPPDLSGIAAFCPDLVLAGGAGLNALDEGRGRIWQVGGWPAEPAGELTVRAFRPALAVGLKQRVGQPVFFTGDAAQPRTLFDHSAQLTLQEYGSASDDPRGGRSVMSIDIGAAAEDGGALLIGGERGALVIVRSPR